MKNLTAKQAKCLKVMEKVVAKFPGVKTVIPGHGKFGGKELLEHTKELLQQFPRYTDRKPL
jgi:metallo-beta-lactamase class B